MKRKHLTCLCSLYSRTLFAISFLLFLFCLTQPAYSAPDLIVTDIQWATNVYEGDEVYFDITIKNQGDVATPSGTAIGVGVWIDSTWVTYTYTTTPLGAGSSVTLNTNVSNIHWDAVYGSHTVQAFVDDQTLISESNESNNTRQENISVLHLPDVRVTDIQWATNLYENDSIYFDITIQNQGQGPTPTGVPIGIGVWIDSVWTTYTYTETPLAAQASVTLNTNVSNLPWTGVYGSHTVLAYVDDESHFRETYENNNTREENFSVNHLPDMIVTSIQWQEPVTENDEMYFNITLKNQGEGPTPTGVAVGVGIWIDSEYVTYAYTENVIPGGDSVTLNTIVSGLDPWTATDGNHTILANVDDESHFNESDETNNTRELNFSVNKTDTDGDGLCDEDEETYDTDPEKKDTDEDRLFDGDEVHTYGSDPTVVDTDNDGLNDGDEVYDYGSNPVEEDTDDDGLSDYDEVKLYHSNPNNADSDNDGIEDYLEVTTYHTNPNSDDTDSDGVKDNDELTLGTDPKSNDSDNDGASDGAEIAKETDPLSISSVPEDYITEDGPKNVQVSVDERTVVITFTTYAETKAHIRYGLNSFYASEEVETNSGTSHSIELTNLKPSSSYHYFINIEESDGNIIGDFDRTFTTGAAVSDNVGPNVTITYPQNGSSTTDSSIKVVGTVDDPYTEVYVNEVKAKMYGTMFISEAVSLNSGTNNITVEAIDPAEDSTVVQPVVYLNTSPVTWITSSNIPEELVTGGVPLQFTGTWTGASGAEISINGKPCTVNVNGTWEGPQNISELDAKIQEISESDPHHLIVKPGMTSLKTTVTTGNPPTSTNEIKTFVFDVGGRPIKSSFNSRTRTYPPSGYEWMLDWWVSDPTYLDYEADYEINPFYDPNAQSSDPDEKKMRYQYHFHSVARYGSSPTTYTTNSNPDPTYTNDIVFKDMFYNLHFRYYNVPFKITSTVEDFQFMLPNIYDDNNNSYPLIIVFRNCGLGTRMNYITPQPFLSGQFEVNNCRLSLFKKGTGASDDYYIVYNNIFDNTSLREFYGLTFPLTITKRPSDLRYETQEGYPYIAKSLGSIVAQTVEFLPLVDLQMDINGNGTDDRPYIDPDDQDLEIESPGALIPLNDDNDDNDDKIDNVDSSVNGGDNKGDNELVHCQMALSSYITNDGEVTLERLNSKVNVYLSRTKGNDNALFGVSNAYTWNLANKIEEGQTGYEHGYYHFMQYKDQLWVEGAAASSSPVDTELKLTYTPPSGIYSFTSIDDTIKMTVVNGEVEEATFGGAKHIIRDGALNYASNGTSDFRTPEILKEQDPSPLCYTWQTSPTITPKLSLTPNINSVISNVKIKIEGKQNSPMSGFVYEKDANLAGTTIEPGEIIVNAPESMKLEKTIMDKTCTLIWKISIDGGKSYFDFAETSNEFFTVAGTPTGNLTYFRLQKLITKACKDKINEEGIADALQTFVLNNTHFDPYGTVGEWALLDGGVGKCDKRASTMEVAVELMGVTPATVERVVATVIGGAGNCLFPVKTRVVNGETQYLVLDFDSGVGTIWNAFEGCCKTVNHFYSIAPTHKEDNDYLLLKSLDCQQFWVHIVDPNAQNWVIHDIVEEVPIP